MFNWLKRLFHRKETSHLAEAPTNWLQQLMAAIAGITTSSTAALGTNGTTVTDSATSVLGAIGANNNNNAFASDLVVANADGSTLEREQFIQEQALSVGTNDFNATCKTSIQTADAAAEAANNLDHLLGLDGATQKYPEQCVADSVIAKIIAKGDPATPSTYDCTTDSLEALSDKVALNSTVAKTTELISGAAVDFGAVAKTSITTACTASTPTAAAVTGAVGSVTGNVGGNVVGSVASVTGAVGSVTGNVGGSTASVTGAVGSVTGNIGGNVVGSVASVTGAVGSVTGSVGSVAANGITATSIAADAINAASVKADAVTKIQAGLATPTNITAGTITTVTNLTNAPTTGDLTATMKTSIQTADAAAEAANNLDHLLGLDGATQKYPEQCVADSVIAKIIAKGDPATPSTYDCTTDSLEALSDKVALNSTVAKTTELISGAAVDFGAAAKASITAACTASTPVAASVTGAIGSVAANGITATSIAADAINAAAVKADAVTKIQAGLMLAASGARILCSIAYWSVPQLTVVVPAGAANQALPDVVMDIMPASAVVVKAMAIFKYRSLTNAGAANKLNGAQHIQIQKGGAGGYADAISLIDDQFTVAAAAVDAPGDVIIGDHNVVAKVTANGTYNFQWTSANADIAGLTFNDVQIGLRIWYSV